MRQTPVLSVTIDRAAGMADLRKGRWSVRVPIAALPGYRALYRRLWARGSKIADRPGPWARFYQEDLRALDAALDEG